eukprot:9212272-Alexandrium_andersonii.AAC.1
MKNCTGAGRAGAVCHVGFAERPAALAGRTASVTAPMPRAVRWRPPPIGWPDTVSPTPRYRRLIAVAGVVPEARHGVQGE